MQVAWPLHVLALASFGLGLGQLLRRRPTPSPHPVRISEVVRELHATRQHLLKDFPPLAMLGLGGLLAYTFLNFFLSVLQLPGSPDSAGNEFVLMNKGQVIRVITETEFRHLQSVETRGFSGHWMLFSAAGLGFFSLRSHKAPNHQPGQDGA